MKLLALHPEQVHKISPRQFEEILYTIYELSGYKVELTKQTRDGGIDLLVWTKAPLIGNDFLTIVQAKRYSKNRKVGASDIRDL